LTNNEVRARCLDCGLELEHTATRCPGCNSARISHDLEVADGIALSASTRFRRKMKGMGTLVEVITNRWKRSGDPRLERGVREDRVIDRERDEYHHITRDTRTGEITHEEHEKLSEHTRKEVE